MVQLELWVLVVQVMKSVTDSYTEMQREGRREGGVEGRREEGRDGGTEGRRESDHLFLGLACRLLNSILRLCNLRARKRTHNHKRITDVN
jgi:hypothetical protein